MQADAVESVASVGSEKPRKVFGRGEWGSVEHGALGEFLERYFVGCSGFLWMDGGVPEIGFVVGQAVGFELYGFAGGILADKDEVSIVCDQDLAIFTPVAADLFAVGGQPGVAGGGLDFDDPASGFLRKGFFLAALLELIFGEEAEVWTASTTIFQLGDAADFWFQRFANFVEEVDESGVEGSLNDGFAAGTNLAEGGEIGFEGSHVRV